jgi:hypothetical protein
LTTLTKLTIADRITYNDEAQDFRRSSPAPFNSGLLPTIVPASEID